MEALRNLISSRNISQKLALFFGLLVFLVLVVGGSSLYLARSISDIAREIKEESDQIDLVDQIHYTFHHLTEATERAVIGVDTLTDAQRTHYLSEITKLLGRYRTKNGMETHATTPLWDAVRVLDSTSQRIVQQLNQSPSQTPSHEELAALMNIELKIQALAHWLSGIHRSRMEKSMGENAWKMRLIFQLYVGFAVIALFLVVGSSWFFLRTIAQPLRSLADATLEVAAGNLNKKMPVNSKDEIGQLSQAFNVMVQRLGEHKDQLQSLATVEERERIARELHDTIAQDLALMHIKISEAEMDLSPDASEPMVATLNELREIVTRAYDDVRQAIFGLRTMVSKGLGFIPALTEYLHEFSQMRKISVNLKVLTQKPIQFSAQAEIQLIHIINEALTNMFKHSEAKEGTLTFEPAGQHMKVTVEDKGKGFNPDGGGTGNGFHLGLKAMRERAELVGGKLSVVSAPGTGTKVIALLPWKADSSYGDDSNSVSR